jgi:peptidoglycan-N-acetylglucosamine deacetylase
VWSAEFEAAYRYGGCWVTALHPSVSGRPARLEVVVELLEEMLGRGDVWLAPLSQIAGYVRHLIDSNQWTPRVVEVERMAAAAADGR